MFLACNSFVQKVEESGTFYLAKGTSTTMAEFSLLFAKLKLECFCVQICWNLSGFFHIISFC